MIAYSDLQFYMTGFFNTITLHTVGGGFTQIISLPLIFIILKKEYVVYMT